MKSIYIVFTHSRKPHFNEMGAKTDEWDSFENVEFVDRLKTNHLTGATVIIDYLKGEIVKTRDNSITYDSIINHVNQSYPEQMAHLDNLIIQLSESMVDTTKETQEQEQEQESD